MGEHAVVYGHPALVAAVGLRLRARATELPRSDARIELELPTVGHREITSWREVVSYAFEARRRWEEWAADPSAAGFDGVRGREAAHGVKVALGEAAHLLGEAGPAGRIGGPRHVGGPALRLEVESGIPVGSGLGSSAALAVAVLSAYLTLRGASPGPERLETLAREVERRQHGLPSGVDAATVIHGGVVWAVRDGEALRTEPLEHVSGRLRRFRAFDTGTPQQSTGAVVGEVRARLRADPRLEEVLEAMARTTRRFRALLEVADDGEDAEGGRAVHAGCLEAIRRYQRGLEALGVVPERVRRLVRAVEERGGAAKISGAGALRSPAEGPPRAGCLLVYPAAAGEGAAPPGTRGPGSSRGAARHPRAGGSGVFSGESGLPDGLVELHCRLGAHGCRRELAWPGGAGGER